MCDIRGIRQYEIIIPTAIRTLNAVAEDYSAMTQVANTFVEAFNNNTLLLTKHLPSVWNMINTIKSLHDGTCSIANFLNRRYVQLCSAQDIEYTSYVIPDNLPTVNLSTPSPNVSYLTWEGYETLLSVSRAAREKNNNIHSQTMTFSNIFVSNVDELQKPDQEIASTYWNNVQPLINLLGETVQTLCTAFETRAEYIREFLESANGGGAKTLHR